MGKGKPSKKAIPPQSGKTPRSAEMAFGATSDIVAWQFQALDPHGPWGWTIDAATILELILPRIQAFESMTWTEIEGKTGSHYIDVESIISSAQKRLSEIGQDDVDSLFSLRLQGKPRIWGIRDRHILKVLWWDPEHAICPSEKKHT